MRAIAHGRTRPLGYVRLPPALAPGNLHCWKSERQWFPARRLETFSVGKVKGNGFRSERAGLPQSAWRGATAAALPLPLIK